MKSISLYFQEGTSDKEYHIQLVSKGSGYVVNFQFGRRGSTLTPGTKTKEGPVSLEAADKIFKSLLREKEGKGYLRSEGIKEDFSAQVGTNIVKETFGVFPQLLNMVEDPQTYIDNDEYLAQEKSDGERRMIMVDSKIRGLNKKGQEVQLPDAVIKTVTSALKKHSEACTLDGEMVGNTEYLFDILKLNGKDLTNLPCIERLKILDTLKFDKNVIVTKTAYTREEKQKMYDELKAGNKEGIVFKKKNSKYNVGRPNSGGNALKHKFYKEATFIVKNFTKGKRSVGLELLDGDKRVSMGKVTIPPNKEVPAVGSTIEVRYLYAYKGGSIFQSVYKDERHDVDVEECTMNQIIYKEGQEVEA